jgi:N-acetyl-gamma-glutamyl-phosphate reductase
VIDVAVIGASGFTGAELLRLCAQHPQLNVRVATGDSMAGTSVGELYPSLAASYGNLRFERWDAAMVDEVQVVFCCLPHGESQRVVPEVIDRARLVVDLGADFRLRSSADYERWYGAAHEREDLLERFVYGLPELHRAELATADCVATPGCYPTAATLPMAPLLRAGLIRPRTVIVDAVSGVSGAGRPPKPTTTFCAVDSDVTAYGLLDHRHTPEMEMNIGAPVLFTPHLVPMSRGILATCYAEPADESVDTAAVLDCLASTYRDEPFVVVDERPPSTKATLGSNAAHLTARVDERTRTVIGLCAIDNLGKGASGAAIQCTNVALGLEETAGLSAVGTYP